MSGHVVVPVEPCEDPSLNVRPDGTCAIPRACRNCLGDGTRAVLDDAKPYMSAEKVVVDADLWFRVVSAANWLPRPLGVEVGNADAVPVERWAPAATVWREVAR